MKNNEKLATRPHDLATRPKAVYKALQREPSRCSETRFKDNVRAVPLFVSTISVFLNVRL